MGVMGYGELGQWVDPESHLKSAFREGRVSLPTFEHEGKVVARYVDPSVVERLTRTAYVTGQMRVQPDALTLQVPSFYAYPQVPGFDAATVFSWWQGQQQAVQPNAWFSEQGPWGGYEQYAPYLFGLGAQPEKPWWLGWKGAALLAAGWYAFTPGAREAVRLRNPARKRGRRRRAKLGRRRRGKNKTR